jgi:hypothetical protein
MRRRSPLTHWYDLALLLVATVLAFASLWLGTWGTLWKVVPIPNELRPGFTYTLSMLFLLTGFLIAIYQQVERLSKERAKESGELLDEVARIGASRGLRMMKGDDALREIAKKLPTVQAIWNTRISERLPNEPFTNQARREYDAALKKAVLSGIVYREILSKSWEDIVWQFFSVNARGNKTMMPNAVNLSVLSHIVPSFVNFIVLAYPDGTQEIYWGWAISRSRGPEQQCFHMANSELAAYYVTWHNELFATGQHL